MNQKINEALKAIQYELGYRDEYSVEAEHITLADNVVIFVCVTDSNRELTIKHSKVKLLISAKGIKVHAFLENGEHLSVNEDLVIMFLNQLCTDIAKKTLDVNTPYSDEVLETLFSISDCKLYTELEMETQIQRNIIKATRDLKEDNDAHLNAVIADIYTDMFYGIRRERNDSDNMLDNLKSGNAIMR